MADYCFICDVPVYRLGLDLPFHFLLFLFLDSMMLLTHIQLLFVLVSQSFFIELFSQVLSILQKSFFGGPKLLKWRNKHDRSCKGQHAKILLISQSASDTIRMVLSVVLCIAFIEMHHIYFSSRSMEF